MSANPITIQKQVRDNSSDIQQFLSDLSSWSTHMKAKELVESGADLQPMEEVPLRNDPEKEVKDKENQVTKMEIDNDPRDRSTYGTKRIKADDYAKWEKFDVEKACEDVDKTESKAVVEETEEQRVKREAIVMKLKVMANEQKDKGNQYLKAKEYGKAVECYTEGIRCDKGNALLYSNRAQAYIFDKQYDKAVEDCTESIRRDSTYVKSYFRRAKALIELKKLNEAKNDLNQALKIDPRNSEVRNMLNDLNRRMTPTTAGPRKKVMGRSSVFPGIRTMFSSNQNNYTPPDIYDDDYNLDDELIKRSEVMKRSEKYPKKILPILKPVERRSKRPLLPIHVKIVGETEKKMKFDPQNSGDLSSSTSTSTLSSTISSPTAGYSTANTPTPPLSSGGTLPNSTTTSLPTLFSKLQMVSVPPKPQTAAQFTLNWKQIRSKPDVCAQYLNQLEANDYLIFQDSMEYTILSDILDLLVWEFLPRKWDITHHLVGLTKIKRFSTLLLFTTEKDRANIRKLISECAEEMQEILKPRYEVY